MYPSKTHLGFDDTESEMYIFHLQEFDFVTFHLGHPVLVQL